MAVFSHWITSNCHKLCKNSCPLQSQISPCNYIEMSSQRQMGYFDALQRVPKSTQCCIEP